MKKILSLFILFLFSIQVWSQGNDPRPIRTPIITIEDLHKDEKPVRISQVQIDVKVVGSLAVTTVDMIFHNPNNRVLEGELQFPLAEGQSISRFALDINGKLREGVTVEKAKGQATFESIIRKNVDPALLEKTIGNNFRTRVYPLPENGTRRLVIAYEQELDKKDDAYRFFLPVEYNNTLDFFDVNLTVFGSLSTPTIENNPWSSFGFNKTGEVYIAKYSAKNYDAKGQIVFSVPIKKKDNSFIEKGKISKQHVFYTKVFPEISEQAKELPKIIDLYWDISGSMENRNFDLESKLLDAYFSKIKDLTVNLYTFNVSVNAPQVFTIKSGDWKELKSILQNVNYDGATQFGELDFSKSKADEILLFSDGLSNLSKSATKTGNNAISVISSSLNTDHSNLQYQALATGGKYINLMRQTPDEATKLLMNENFRLISADYNKKEIVDFTSSGSIIKPSSGFSMAGKLLTSKATVTLKFGIGKKVLYTERINFNINDSEDYNNIVERVWAAKKISELDLLYDKNKSEIESIGKQYNIVTRNTSLIVLETVEDYIQYGITPPEELLTEYKKLMKKKEDNELDEKEDKIADIIYLLEERQKWWNKKFSISKKPKERTNKNQFTNTEFPPIRPNVAGKINGTVVDNNGDALIGVSVIIKGTNIGVLTDMNGGFSIDAKDGDILEFYYVGYKSQQLNVSGSIVDISLQEDERHLDEVVVTGYTTNPTTSETDKDLNTSLENVPNELQGRVPGISIQNTETEENENIRIRGTASIPSSGTPLYIVDGVPVDNLDNINPDDIESTGMFKDAAATSIYGSRAVNGVVVITTKNGQKYTHPVISRDKSIEEGTTIKGIALKNWEPDAPYMETLKKATDKDLYTTYLELRIDNKDTPSFFLDVATVFEKRDLEQEQFLILSNLAEMDLQNYQLMRVLGHRFMQLGYTEYAINQFKDVLELRPEEPQSYRDLALSLEQNKDYQEAVDLLYEALFKEWDNRFKEIEIILLEEMNHVIATAEREGMKLNLEKIDKKLIYHMPVDIRIVLNWDTDNSDMDLWVTDPNGERCYYSNPLTEIGGMISDDFTGGYGPEEFLIKKAMKGKYIIQTDYFGTDEQTIIGPSTIYLDIFTNYGRPNEKKRTIMLRLTEEEGDIEIGEITW